MAKSNAQDTQKVLALLKAALGDFDAKLPLQRLFEKAPKCGPFEWMLCILSIEIDLRVDIPEKLADNRKLTALEFAEKISSLPRVKSAAYTMECLALVAQALLSLDIAGEEAKPKAKRTPKKAAKKAAKKAPVIKPAAKSRSAAPLRKKKAKARAQRGA